MSDLRTAAQQAIGLICSARLCEVNSMSSRQEMLRLLIEATDTLRAALAQQAEPVQDRRCRAEPRSDGDFVCDCKIGDCLGRSAALAQQAEPVAERAFLERILAAMEGVIDVADRKTAEFDALRSCVIDLTVMLHAAPPQRVAQQAEPAQEPYTSERHFALREAYCIGAADAFWKARPGTKDDGRTIAFDAGFARGFDKGTCLAEQRLAALAQRAEPVQEPAFHGFMSDDGTQVDVCFSPSAPRRDGTYATAYYTAPPHRVAQQAEPVEEPAYKVKVAGRWHEAEPLAAAFNLPDGEHLLYTAPPQRRPLTEKEMLGIIDAELEGGSLLDVARAVERAHGIKE